MQNNIKNYDEIISGLKDILQNRLTSKKVLLFKDFLKSLKSVYNIEVTTVFLKGLFPNNPLLQKNLNTRISRILKRAEIQTANLTRFYTEQKSEHGGLYYCYKKKPLKCLIV